jgi:hypothetical protein
MKTLERIRARCRCGLDPLRARCARTGESLSLLYDLRQKPRIVLFWFRTAARNHTGYIFVVLALLVAASIAGDAFVDRVFRSEAVVELVSGLSGAKSRGDIRRERAKRLLGGLLWLAGTGAVGVRLLGDVKTSIGCSVRAARSLARKADDAVDVDPSRSLALYRSAVGLTCYPGDESALRKKIRAAERSVATPREAVAREAPRAPERRTATIGDRYEITAELGRGASGTVYRAADRVLERDVALKELNVTVTDDDSRTRFRREAQILARLNHPHIVQVFDLLEHGARVWIAMELVDGGDLASLLARRGRLGPEETVRMGERMAKALAFAHEKGVVHRDVKPLNVLLVDEQTPKITDFGLARLSEGTVHTVEGMVLGSPRYMSPEQAEGRRADERSDIYSFGIVVYHMLAGQPPFDGDVRSVLMQHIRRRPKPLFEAAPDVPPALAQLVDRMLSKDPGERPASMDVVAEQLAGSIRSVTAG